MPVAYSPDRYTSASGIGAGLVEYADSCGLDIRPECASLGLDPEIFNDMTARISLGRYCQLLERCAEMTGDEAFGLKFAARYKIGATGPYGYGLMTAPTLEDFLRFQSEHVQYASQTIFSKLTLDKTWTIFDWTYSPVIFKRDQYVDQSLALIFRHMRKILGPAIGSIEVELERPPPEDDKPFKAVFGQRVRFGCRINRLRIPSSLLAVRNPGADARLFKLMDMQCRDLRPTLDENSDFIQEIKDFILARLADDDVSLTTAAVYFNVSERTLQRRLSDMHTTLNELRDEARRELAGRMLAETALSATEICYRLGYSAPSAFTRSFQRWFGISPKEYRHLNKVVK